MISLDIFDVSGQKALLTGDATTAADTDAIVAQTITEFGHIDTLVNCVGDAIRKPVAQLPGSDVPGMTYFVVMSTADNSGSNYYELAVTNSGDEVVHPTGTTGWSIADALRSKSGSNAWGNMTGNPTALLHIAADE